MAKTVTASRMTNERLGKCLEDKHWRKNNLYSIVDESGQAVRYIQRPVIADYCKNKHGLDVILKSRQHGFSSETEIDFLDDAINIPNLQIGIIAHTKIDAQEIFQTKIKYPFDHIHPYLKEKIGKPLKDDAGTLRLRNGSEIRVAVSFRSATTHRLHISEYGKICAKYPKRAEEIKTGTLPSIHPQLGGKVVIESTAEGAAGDFYDLCMRAQADTLRAQQSRTPLSKLQYHFHFYPWYKDPKNQVEPLGIDISDQLHEYFEELDRLHNIKLNPKQKAWYSVIRDGSNGLRNLMKREHPSTVDEAFEATVEGAVYAEEITQLRNTGGIGFYPWVKTLPVNTFWDLGYGDATCCIFVQKVGEQRRIIDFYQQVGRGAPYHAAQINNKEYVYEKHYMPHDVMNHEKGTGIVLKDTYQSLLKQPIETVERPKLKVDGIQAVRNIFNDCVFNEITTRELIRALAYYRYEWDEDYSVFKKDPIHDWASHPADAMQTMALKEGRDRAEDKILRRETVRGYGKHPSDMGVQDLLAV